MSRSVVRLRAGALLIGLSAPFVLRNGRFVSPPSVSIGRDVDVTVRLRRPHRAAR